MENQELINKEDNARRSTINISTISNQEKHDGAIEQIIKSESNYII